MAAQQEPEQDVIIPHSALQVHGGGEVSTCIVFGM